MKGAFVIAVLVGVSPPVLAKWELHGSSLNSMVANDAKAPAHITARLQIECLTRSEPVGLSMAVALSENVPKVGSVGWSIQFDGGKTAHYPARRFLETTHITLGGPMSYELKEVQTAERLRLTLRPTGGDELDRKSVV